MTGREYMQCLTPLCPNRIMLVEGHESARIWISRSQGWGIIGDLVYCPQHSGRLRTRPVIPKVLPGQLDMFDLPEGAVVPKRKKSKKPTS